MNYTNPRTQAVFEDWPWGARERTTATFEIEKGSRGERCVRTVVDPYSGRTAEPKKLTFSTKQRIVDGDDGKTYIACLTMYNHITVMQSNMQYSAESVFERDPRYVELRQLFSEAP